MSEVHVTGLADLQKFLDQLPAKVEANIMRGALRAGANVIKDEAKRLVPVDSGLLRKSIKVFTRFKRGKVTASVTAGGSETKKTVTRRKSGGISVRYGNPFYAAFVEYGTAPHFIKSLKEKQWMLRPNKRATSGTAKRLVITSESGKMHPGARPKPFLRPALDSQAQKAVIAAADYIKKRLATKHGIDTAHIKIEGDE